jgi:hypothetical protein
MHMVIRLLLPLVGLVASIATLCAHAPVALAEDNIDWPSPTGKFAFRTRSRRQSEHREIDDQIPNGARLMAKGCA